MFINYYLKIHFYYINVFFKYSAILLILLEKNETPKKLVDFDMFESENEDIDDTDKDPEYQPTEFAVNGIFNFFYIKILISIQLKYLVVYA